MADFSDALDLALEALARRGPAGGDAVLAAMRPLLLAAGPVPSRGPLTHDLVVPGAAVGANVFEHGRALGLDAALHGFATGLGRGPEAASLLGEPGTSWAGGLLRRPGETRLKLYRVAPEPPLGVDLTARGPERWRRYVPPFPLDWPGAEWPPPQPGESHRLITVLGEEKRTLNVIFRPGAPLEPLLALGAPTWLRGLDGRSRALGFPLRPVAWELDLYADGRREVDVLVALGSADAGAPLAPDPRSALG